jgi:hypothetical protein
MSRIKDFAEDNYGVDWADKLAEKGELTDQDRVKKEPKK